MLWSQAEQPIFIYRNLLRAPACCVLELEDVVSVRECVDANRSDNAGSLTLSCELDYGVLIVLVHVDKLEEKLEVLGGVVMELNNAVGSFLHRLVWCIQLTCSIYAYLEASREHVEENTPTPCRAQLVTIVL
jgi:hypothetical protein